jgi:hypothetical protein
MTAARKPYRFTIGIGRTHARTHVIVLVQDLDIRIINAATGELLRELVFDPTKRYQGTGRPPGPPPVNSSTAEPTTIGFSRPGCLETSHTVGVAVFWFRTSRTGVSRHAGLMSPEIPD